MDLEARFWSKVEVRGDDECWEWQAHRDRDGYGKFKLLGGMVLAHRVAWLLTHDDPGEKHVLHTCDNPPCVNPRHLYLGTHTDNMRDAGKLTYENVEDIRARLARGETYRVIAADYGVVVATISHIATGRNWKENEHG